jgi:hypothetical protein
MRAQPLPSLFGRFTAILAAHEDLSAPLERLRDLCDALDAGAENLAWRIKPPTLALDLQERLSTHFAVEEADIYFGTIAHDRPDLIVAVATLRAEHAVMLSLVERLRDLSTQSEAWRDLVLPGRVLLSMFEAHEQAESRLLDGFLTAQLS